MQKKNKKKRIAEGCFFYDVEMMMIMFRKVEKEKNESFL